MKKLRIKVEKGSDYYSAFAENCKGIYGVGDSVEEAKANALEGLNLLIKSNSKLPEILNEEYEIEYIMDTRSFIEYYSRIFTKSALQRITGINQKQLGHYVSGIRRPTRKTVEKIEDSIHRIAAELSQTHLT